MNPHRTTYQPDSQRVGRRSQWARIVRAERAIAATQRRHLAGRNRAMSALAFRAR